MVSHQTQPIRASPSDPAQAARHVLCMPKQPKQTMPKHACQAHISDVGHVENRLLGGTHSDTAHEISGMRGK